MGSRIKEDERTEKAIRSLLKLPENRRCINCNSLGPQYVCSTFWTFVCTNCSGIHREFTHRVKSVSMAKFTAEEVGALRAGGNERARQIYFKEWDTQRGAYPDGSNIFKLRDFIRSVYVDKRYSNESNDKISRHKPAPIEDYSESKKASANFFESRSLHSVDKSEMERPSGHWRSGSESLKFYFDDKKHKQHVTHNPRSRGLPKSPIRFEVVDDRFREDGSIKRYDGRKDLRGSSKSLDLSNNKDMSSSSIKRHNSELLGDNAPPLCVGNAVKVEKKKDPVNNQMTASSDKLKSPRSLIDDVPVSEPSNESIDQSPSEHPAAPEKTEDPAPNSLEALLFGLSAPSVVPGTDNSELWNKNDMYSTVSESNYPAANLGTQTVPTTPDNVTSIVMSPPIAHTESSHGDSSSLALTTAADNTDSKETATSNIAANNQDLQTYVGSASPNGLSDTSMELSTLDISYSAHGLGPEHHQDETKTSIRNPLPEDLFTGGFSYAPPQVLGQLHGIQYYQYPLAMGAYNYAAKPKNPFDLSCDDTDVPNQTQQFLALPWVQEGGLPHVSASIGYPNYSSPAADSIGLMTSSQSPYYTNALSPIPPSLASPGVFVGQQSQMNMFPSFRQEINGFGTEENTFNAANICHQPNNGYPSANPNAYISRGNPFE